MEGLFFLLKTFNSQVNEKECFIDMFKEFRISPIDWLPNSADTVFL